MSLKQLFTTIFFVFSIFKLAFAQNFINEDWVYQPYIKSVKLVTSNSFAVNAIVEQQKITNNIFAKNTILAYTNLSSVQNAFALTFDDLRNAEKRYRYKIVMCDADWTTSYLPENEYIIGFSEDNIGEPTPSDGVFTEYNNYRTIFPSPSTKITKSGNYMIHVFEDNEERTPILSRRFLVVEKLVNVSPRFTLTHHLFKSRTHHEIDFTVSSSTLQLTNNSIFVKASVLQNGRWDTEKANIPKSFISGKNLEFDYQDSLVFAAGKQFRYFDARSLTKRSVGISSIDNLDEYDIKVKLNTDKVREDKIQGRLMGDLNGDFYIDNLDELQNRVPTNMPINTFDDVAAINNTLYPNGHLESDYADIQFSLKVDKPIEDADVYVMGKAFDWQCYPENKMTYNEKDKQYEAEISLKQGYYNYDYAVVPKKGKKKPYDTSYFDGNWYETENIYTVIVYGRTVYEKYDRIIGIGFIQSKPEPR